MSLKKLFQKIFGPKSPKSTPKSTAPTQDKSTDNNAVVTPSIPEEAEHELSRDYVKALEWNGLGERFADFVGWFSKHWKIVRLPQFKTIVGSKHAWCGYGMAVAAMLTYGMDYVAANGALAKNYDRQINAAGKTISQQIDFKVNGSPRSARVRINHYGDCSRADGNHVGYAHGSCTAADLLKPGATIDIYGGNQNDEWNVSTYCANGTCPKRSKPKQKICTVTWLVGPEAPPIPKKITKSVNCTSSKTAEGSTR